MREIKFRAWDEENKEMIYWDDFVKKYHKTRLVGFFTAKHLIPLQYTSLKDKNGEEIYEGDVVRDIYDDVWEVKIKNLEDGVVLTNHDLSSLKYVEGVFALGECEVLGNRFEKPELLEEK